MCACFAANEDPLSIFVLNRLFEENAMRKARDKHIRIAASFFRNSFDEEDDEEKTDEAPLPKESEKTFSQTISDSDSIRVSGKSNVTNVNIPSKLIAPDFELAASILYVEDYTFEHLQSNNLSSSNVDEHVISDRNAKKENRENRNSDVISKFKTRRLPRTDCDSIFPAFKHEDVAKDSSSSIEDYPARAYTKPAERDRSKHSQLTPDFLKIPSGSSEHFRFSTLSERSTSAKECSDVGKIRVVVQQPSLTAAVRDSFDEKSSTSSGRRLTLPMTSSDLNRPILQNPATEAIQKSPTLKNILAGTSVNPIRKSSIANAAICSSLAPSLLGAIPGVPNSLLPNGDSNLQRSATLSNLSTTSSAISDDISIGRTRRGLRSFLRLHIPEPHSTIWHDIDEDYHHHLHNHHHHHHHHMFSHIPTITFTAPATDGIGRKFNFAIRRHSQAVSVKPGCTSFCHFR